MNLDHALDTALEAARESRAILKGYFGGFLTVDEKPGQGRVTEADRESERIIRSVLSKRLPNANFLGEESGLSKGGENDLTWIVDPLDGTHNFLSGFPIYCSSIALAQGQDVLVGVVDVPEMNLTYQAVKGRGALLNGKQIKVNPRPMRDVLLATGFAYQTGEVLNSQVDLVKEFAPKCLGIRRPGAAALDLCWVASGAFGGFWEMGLQPWDLAAGSLIVREAGGLVTNYDGSPLKLDGGNVLACAPQLQTEMLNVLSNS